MSDHSEATTFCPSSGRDVRKSAAIAEAAGGDERIQVVGNFAKAREILRDPDARQAGFLAELISKVSLTHAPVLYQHGAEHRRQRSATARFFAPRVVTTAYRTLMERTSDELIERFQVTGRADLGGLGLEMAVTIAAEIVGLTNSDRAGMARRLEALVNGMPQGRSRLGTILGYAKGQIQSLNFLVRDVKPAIRDRRQLPREDVISHLLSEGYSEREILTECLTYGAAGMITTREFITMAGWHLLEKDDLRQCFLAGDETSQIAILEEILRLEPVVGTLFRRLDVREHSSSVVAVDIREANVDQTAVGECPYHIYPDRMMANKVGRAGLSFGDGEHRCPGAQVALQETAIFLDRLLRVPGIHLDRIPDIGWNALITGYELRGANLTCTRAPS